MTNPMKGEIQVSIGSETYNCRLTVDALIRIEEQLDKGILQITQNLAAADIRIADLVVILHQALRGGGKDIDEKDARLIVQNNGLVDSARAVAELLTQTLSDPNEESSGKKEVQAGA